MAVRMADFFHGKFVFSELVQNQVLNSMFKGILNEDSVNAVSHNALQVLGFLFYPSWWCP